MLKKNKVVTVLMTLLVALCLLLGISLFGCQDDTTSTSSVDSVDSTGITSTANAINPNPSTSSFSSSNYTTIGAGADLINAINNNTGTKYIKLQEGAQVGQPAIGVNRTLVINSGTTVNLDLNGRVIAYELDKSYSTSTSGSVFYINGGTLNIYDSRANATAWFYNNNGDGGSFSFIGTFSAAINNWIYGGFIMGGKGIKSGNNYLGGGIYINSGTVNMYGGSIAANTVQGDNGASASHGGGVYINGGTLNMYGGGVFGNYAKGYGGGVYVANSGTFNMIPSGKAVQVSYNIANVGGGVCVASTGSNTFTGGEINNNTAGVGGGLYVMTGKTIANNTIGVTVSSNNASSGDGGGIYLGGDTRTVTGTIAYNTANGKGAGIYKLGGSLTFSGNLQSNGTLGVNSGSAIYNNDGAFTMSGGTIRYNKGIAAVYMNAGTFTMTGGSIYRNIANKGAVGGVFISDSITSIGISGSSQIKENFAGDNLSVDEGSGAVANAMASTSSASNLYMTLSSAGRLGIGTLTSAADIRVSLKTYSVGSMVTMNYGRNNGSSAHVSEYVTLDNPSYGVEQKMGTTGNEAWIVNAVATVRTEPNYFHAGYQTLYYASNRYNKYSNDDNKVLQLIAENSVATTGALSQNGIVDLNGYKMAYTSASGAPLQINAGATVTLKDSRASTSTYKYTQADNTSAYTVGTSGTNSISGGVITGGKQGGIYVLGTLNMQAGTLAGNEGQGGLNIASGGRVTIQGNVSVEGNTSTSNGGGIVIASGATLDAPNQTGYNLTVKNNYAVTNGGGIYALGDAILYKATIQNNRTGSNGTGGGIYVGGASDSVQTIIGATTISGNYARNGGGIYVAKGKLNYAGQDANTTGNDAQDGAGIYVAGGVAALGAGQITGNTATGYGGGLYVVNSTNVTISNLTISNNTTYNNVNSRGGGIYLKSGTITMTSGSIKGNTCVGTVTNGGGGVFVESGEFAMSGGEVTLNAGIGGGIRASGGTVNLSGTAHVNKNVSTSQGSVAGIHIENGATIKMGGSVQVTGNVRSGTVNSAKTDIESGSGYEVNGSIYYNLFLVDGKTITVTSALTSDANIGISLYTMPSTTARAITTGYTGSVAPENIFTLDPTNTINIVTLNNSEAAVALAVAAVTIGTNTTYYNSFASALATYNGNASGTRLLQLLGNNEVTTYSEFAKSGNLDLNGYILRFTGSSTNAAVIGVASGVNLTIEDSTTSRTHYYTKNSNGAYSFFNDSGAEQPASGSVGYLTGGVITGGTGGGVYIRGTGTVTMQAGTLSGNTSSNNSVGAGATIVEGGTLTLNGTSKICGNASPSNIAGGVNIAAAGTLNMAGSASIANNVASTYGGGVHIGNGGSLSMTGTSSITGNSLTGASGLGGGVYSNASSTITLTSNATISGNSAKSNGGGIYSSGALIMSGSVQVNRNNTVNGVGGGVYVKEGSTSTMSVSGSVSINNNTKGTSSAADNIYLATGRSITIAGTITDGAHLGVTLQTPTSGTVVATSFGSHSTYDPGDILTIDDTSVSLGLSLQNGNVVLGEIVAVVISGSTTQEFGTLAAAVERYNAITTDDNKILQLKKDVRATDTTQIEVSGTLDLNGHILDAEDAAGNISTIWVSSTSATLTIIDSSPSTIHYYTLGDQDKYVFQDAVSATSVTGGVITGGHATTGHGGGIYVQGKLIMKGGTIAGNGVIASEGRGGGVFVSTGATFTMLGGSIVGNYASGYGGGVNVEEGAMFIFSGGTIANNNATNGGGISAMGAKADADQASVVITQGINNATSNTTSISANKVSRYGGGLYIYDGASVIMQGGSIDRNVATISGGNSCFGGGVFIGSGSLSMSGGVIEKNYSKTYGAGIYLYSSTSSLTMDGSATVQGNYASSGAGGIQADSGEVTIIGNAQVIDNKSNKGSIAGVHVASGATIKIGGSVKIWNNIRGYSSWNAETYTAIPDDSFNGGKGAAKNLYLVNGTSATANPQQTLKIESALSSEAYIGISFQSTTNNVAFTTDYNTYNSSAEPSDYILLDDYSTSASLTTTDARAIAINDQGELVVTHAKVVLDSPANNYAQGYAAFSTAVARYNRLSNDDNKVIRLLANAPTSTTNTITQTGKLDLNGHILYNVSGSTGNQILVINSGLTFTIEDDDVTTTHYYTKGTGTLLYTFLDSLYNELTSSDSSTSLTGGIITGGLDTAIVVKGNLILEGVAIAGNSASTSGGCGGAINVYPNATLTLNRGVKIVGNTANGSGAGIYSNGNVTINDANIDENFAGIYGGGIYSAVGALTINGGTVSGNTSRHGAGIYLVSGSATLNATNNSSLTISRNFAVGTNYTNGEGGGIYVSNAALTINGATISYNRGLGAGAYIYNGSFNMTSGAITKNGSPTDGSVAGVHFNINGSATVAISGNSKIVDNYAHATQPIADSKFITADQITADDQSTDRHVVGAQSNLYLPSSKTIDVSAGLTEGAMVSFMPQNYTIGKVITSGYTASSATTYFVLDNNTFTNHEILLTKSDSGEVILAKGVATVTYTNDNGVTTTTPYLTFEQGLTAYNSVEGTATNVILKLLQGVTSDDSVLTTSTAVFTRSGTFDINGIMLKYTGATAGSVIQIGTTSAVTELTLIDSSPSTTHLRGQSEHITGGLITGGNGVTYGGGVNIVSGSTFVLQGGNIAGNSVSSSGGGIYVDQGATLTITKGRILGNYVTGVNGAHGGGVYVAQGATINISGSPTITYNYLLGDGNTTYTNNIELGNNVKINIAGTLSNAMIGVTMNGTTYGASNDTVYSNIEFTTNYATNNTISSATVNPAEFFTSDVTGYVAQLSSNNEATWLIHLHNWTFEKVGDSIVATCINNSDNSCPLEKDSSNQPVTGNGGNLTITAPTGTVYDGLSGHSVTESGTMLADAKNAAQVTVTYKYKENDTDNYVTTLDTINAGYYEATLTVKGNLTLTTTYQVAKATLTLSVEDSIITYGEAGANNGITPDGWKGNDTAVVTINKDNDTAVLSGTNISAVVSFTYLTKDGATYQIGDPVGYEYQIVPQLTSASAKNYNIVLETDSTGNVVKGTLTVKKRSLYITSITAAYKVYDGTTEATLTVTLDGLLEKDKTLVQVKVSGVFDNKNVAVDEQGNVVAKLVKMTGAELEGAEENIQNYEIKGLGGNANGQAWAKITPKEITNVSGINAIGKEYDGTTATYYNANNAQFVGVLTSDNVTVASIKSVNFDTPNVAYDPDDKTTIIDKTVYMSGIVLGGNDGVNYYVSDTLQLTAQAKIRPIAVTIEGVTANNKVYDGTDVAEINYDNAKVSGILSQDGVLDDVTVAKTGTAQFVNKDQGTGKTVKITGLTITGANAGNYTYVSSTVITTSADISRRKIYVYDGITAEGKEYDKTTTVDVFDFSNAKFIDTVTGKDVTEVSSIASDFTGLDTIRIYATLEFSDANAGANVPINVTIIELLGDKADNYTLDNKLYNSETPLTAEIRQRVVYVTELDIDDKDYDGNFSATPLYESLVFSRPDGYGGNPVMDGDQLTVTATAEFTQKKAGDGIPVSITNIQLAGSSAANYVLDPNTPNTLTSYADIRKVGITVIGGITANERQYNSSDVITDVDVSNAQFSGVIPGDDVTIDGFTAQMKDKSVGDAKDVDIVFSSLGGADADNYYLANDDYEGNLTVKITPVEISMTGQGIIAMDKTHDGTTEAEIEVQNAKFTGVIEGDIIGVTVRGEFGTSDANDELAQEINITRALLTGPDAGNYVLNAELLAAMKDSPEYTAPTAYIFRREVNGPDSIEYSVTLTYTGEYHVSTELVKLPDINRAEGTVNEASEFVSGELDNVIKDVGTYTVRLTLQDPVNTRWADGVRVSGQDEVAGNYIDFTVIVNPLVITKPTQTEKTYEYNGEVQTFELEYDEEYAEWFTITGDQQKNGTHTVTVELKDAGNVMWDDGTTAAVTFQFSIIGEPIFWLEILLGVGVLFELFWLLVLAGSKNKNKKNGTAKAIAPLPIVGILLTYVPNWEFWLILVLAVVVVVLLVALLISTHIYFKNRKMAKDGDRIESEGLAYELTNDGECYSVDGIGSCSQNELVISAYVDGIPVTRIKAGAFSNCKQLTGLFIPSTVTEIGTGAFEGCDNLMNVTFSTQGKGKWRVSLDGKKGKNISSKLKKQAHAAKLLTLDLTKYIWTKK
jgi:hypothetical protein